MRDDIRSAALAFGLTIAGLSWPGGSTVQAQWIYRAPATRGYSAYPASPRAYLAPGPGPVAAPLIYRNTPRNWKSGPGRGWRKQGSGPGTSGYFPARRGLKLAKPWLDRT